MECFPDPHQNLVSAVKLFLLVLSTSLLGQDRHGEYKKAVLAQWTYNNIHT